VTDENTEPNTLVTSAVQETSVQKPEAGTSGTAPMTPTTPAVSVPEPNVVTSQPPATPVPTSRVFLASGEFAVRAPIKRMRTWEEVSFFDDMNFIFCQIIMIYEGLESWQISQIIDIFKKNSIIFNMFENEIKSVISMSPKFL
jgi:hypothetical protein